MYNNNNCQMDKKDPVWLKIRKLRKKLRQIEHLDGIDRELTDEEISKCIHKHDIRDQLVQLLTNEAEFSYNSATTNNEIDDLEPDLDVDPYQRNDDDLEPDLDVNPYQGNDDDIATGDTNVVESYTVSEDDIEVEQILVTDDDNTNNSNVNDAEHPGSVRHNRSESPVATCSASPDIRKPATPPQPSPPKKSKKSGKSDTKREGSQVGQQWRNSGFVVTAILSHNDLVTAVDCHGNLFISASRDTTIKVWDVGTLRELRSLGSHTGCVTDVKIIPGRGLGELGNQLGVSEEDHLVLSGSLDCSVKLWSASTGELLKSIYTYNPVTKIAFHPQLSAVITVSGGGKLELYDLVTKETICSVLAHSEAVTGGGKLELYDLVTKETICSVLAHSEAVTGLCTDGKRIYTSSADGDIKVYEIRDKALHCVFVSESVKTERGVLVMRRHVRSLAVKGDNLYYGDDGVNIKHLAWKKGLVKKICNHREEFGMTDSLCCHGNLLLSSAYDLDTGMGYINVQDITTEPRYLTSIHDEDSGRIMTMTVSENPDTHCLVLITGGSELKVWKQTKLPGVSEEIVPTRFIHRLSQPALDSDIESDAEFSESDSDLDCDVNEHRRRISETESRGGLMSWCSVV